MYSDITHKQPVSEATRVTLLGMALDLMLGVAKIIGGLLANSLALVIDGVHSLSDAISDVFVLAVVRIAGKAPDENHPYGHGRFETLGTIAMGLLFFCTAGIILYDAGQRLLAQDFHASPTVLAVIITLVSIASKEWIFHYTMAVAKRLNSSLLRANAWHSRSDGISSVAVLIGLLGAQMGYLWMDVAAAMFVALIIARIGWELCYDSVKELVDTALPAAKREKIGQLLTSLEGVREVTEIRSRSSGGQSIVEVSVTVDPRITVSEGHGIGELCSRKLTGQFEEIRDVITHIDPDNAQHGGHQPGREQLLQHLKESWQGSIEEDEIEGVDFHYLNPGVEAELRLHRLPADPQGLEKLAEKLRQGAEAGSVRIDSLRVYSKLLEANLRYKVS